MRNENIAGHDWTKARPGRKYQILHASGSWCSHLGLTTLDSSTSPALLSTAHDLFLVPAPLLGFPQRMSHDPSVSYILESPLQCRLYISSFMQRPSYGESDPTTQPSWRVFLELCKSPWLLLCLSCFQSHYYLDDSFKYACLKCSLIPLYYCYSGICLPLRLTQGTCFHRLPFWISKLLWWCSQLWFSLLHEFHKLGFWMDVWGLAFRELFLFPGCRTQDLSFTVLVWQLQKLYLPAPSLFHYTGHSPFLNKPQFSYIFGFSTYWLE